MVGSKKKSGAKNPVALRLKQARRSAGFRSGREAAAAFNWSPSTLSQHESGVRGIKHMAGVYAHAFNVTEEWLLHGDDPPAPAIANQTGVRQAGPVELPDEMVDRHPDCVWVDFYQNAQGDSHEELPLPFRVDDLTDLGLSVEQASMLRMGADNAALEFPEKAVVLFDTRDKDISRPGQFAVRSATGALAILKLRRLIGTEPPEVRVTAEPIGEDAHSYTVPLATLIVVGRVRWVGKRL